MAHFNRNQCYKVIELINNNNLEGCIKYLDDNIKSGQDWVKYGNKFKTFLNDILNNKFDNIPFTILKQGNKKLSYLFEQSETIVLQYFLLEMRCKYQKH